MTRGQKGDRAGGSPSPGSPVDEAIAAIRRGSLVVIPTDTVYGLGTRPDDPAATARIFEVKGRPRDLTLPVLVPDEQHARGIASFDERAERLVAAFWPGSLTIVLPRTIGSASWDLGGDPGTVGVRVPGHRLARSVLAGSGPMAVTSANRSGEPPCTTGEQLVAAFGDTVAIYLCDEVPLDGVASTVVDLAHGELKVLRQGSLQAERIRAVADGH